MSKTAEIPRENLIFGSLRSRYKFRRLTAGRHSPGACATEARATAAAAARTLRAPRLRKQRCLLPRNRASYRATYTRFRPGPRPRRGSDVRLCMEEMTQVRENTQCWAGAPVQPWHAGAEQHCVLGGWGGQGREPRLRAGLLGGLGGRGVASMRGWAVAGLMSRRGTRMRWLRHLLQLFHALDGRV